jgi:hypothetical protein
LGKRINPNACDGLQTARLNAPAESGLPDVGTPQISVGGVVVGGIERLPIHSAVKDHGVFRFNQRAGAPLE